MTLYKPLIRFFVYAFLIYIGWYFLYGLWLEPNGKLDSLTIDNTIFFSERILNLLGYDVHIDQRNIYIPMFGGAWVGNACNGIPLFVLFTGFVLAFPGPVSKKLLFIPMGILSIHILNIFRVVGLILIQGYAPGELDFNHTYTFTIIVYGYIFVLWMVWVNYFSKIRKG